MDHPALKRTGSGGLFYRLYRKFRYLKYRGTLLHKTSRSTRRLNRLRRRRRWRHIFLFARPFVFSRLRRAEKYKLEKIISGPHGYESFSGKKQETQLPEHPKKNKLTLSERYYRLIRIIRFIRRKRKLRKEQRKNRKKKRSWRRILRILFYLIRTGKLFKIDYVALRAFLDRNYSFLGKASFIIIFLNSTVLYIITYLIIYIVKSLATVFAANAYQVDTIIFYHDVIFLIRSMDWHPDMVQVVFAAAPFVCLFIFLISVVIYANTRLETWSVRLFIFWLMCHTYVQLFGEMMIGSLLSKGFGWTIAYLLLDDTPKLLVSLVGVILLVTAGFILARPMLYTGNLYFNKLDKRNRMPFVMSQIFLPFLAGSFFLIMMKQPLMHRLEFSVALSMLLLLLPAVIRARFFGTIYFDEDPRKIKIYWAWLLIMVIFVIAFRIIFGIGVRFGF